MNDHDGVGLEELIKDAGQRAQSERNPIEA